VRGLRRGRLLQRRARRDIDGSRCQCPRIASDGDDYLVVWAFRPDVDATEIHAAQVSATGAVLDAPPLTLKSYASGYHRPHVVFDGTRYLVVTDGDGGLDTWRVGSNGTKGALTTTEGTFGYVSDLAWGKGQGLVAFGPAPPFIYPHAAFARINGDGALLDEVPGDLGPIVVATAMEGPHAAWDGNDYVLGWHSGGVEPDDAHFIVTRISPSGDMRDPGGIELPSIPLTQPNLASLGRGQTLIAYDDYGQRYVRESGAVRAFGYLVGTETAEGGEGGGAGASGGTSPSGGGHGGGPSGGGAAPGRSGSSEHGGEANGGHDDPGEDEAGTGGAPDGKGGVGAGGTPTTGGSSGAHARGGSGGSAGGAGTASHPPTEPPPDSGCGCSVPKRGEEPLSFGTLLLAASALIRLRRRRQRLV
jgi:hypothetical protein